MEFQPQVGALICLSSQIAFQVRPMEVPLIDSEGETHVMVISAPTHQETHPLLVSAFLCILMRGKILRLFVLSSFFDFLNTWLDFIRRSRKRGCSR
ncbi:hypothetical protein HNP81_002889 [Peribacillus huizhouensis]|uniref:Uncharacterized protein n=1 Tax=Peribacillus huizhouensis TaxID=1501239 RepID=A0ABR6CRD8_9BACI|nr:hypothetical protein [Peribacillus huizhouensis]